MALLRSAATVAGYTMLSRVLGFVRDIAIAAVVGAGPVADAFITAFRSFRSPASGGIRDSTRSPYRLIRRRQSG